MPNYRVFTQICVVHEFRGKKLKNKKKQQIGLKLRAVADLAKAGNADYHNSVAAVLKGKVVERMS